MPELYGSEVATTSSSFGPINLLARLAEPEHLLRFTTFVIKDADEKLEEEAHRARSGRGLRKWTPSLWPRNVH